MASLTDNRRAALAAWLLITLCAARVQAGGLMLPEPNAAALGRAGAVAALPEGPSAIYYNPAGLTLGHGLSLEAGVTANVDRQAATIGGDSSHASTTTAIPSLFLAQRLGDHFGLGLGFYRAPAQSLDWPDSFAGRFRVQRASFGGTTLAPAVAGRPFSFLAIGFALTIHFGELELAQALGDTRYETRLSFTGKAIGLGASIGLWARLYRQYLSFGFTYHSAVDLDHSGRVTTTLPPSTTPLAVDDGRLTLPLPHVFTFALGSRPRPGTSVGVQARLGLMDDLDGFVIKDTATPPATLLAIPLSNRFLVQLRAGAEQKLVHDRLALRLGIGYDLGSARRDLDPAFPDGDRVVVSGGIGYTRPDFSFDAGYQGAFSPGSTGNRGIAYPADYAGQRHQIGASLTIHIVTVGPRPQKLD
jgi:long-chain fatty acid transport protein